MNNHKFKFNNNIICSSIKNNVMRDKSDKRESV